jgi:SSS family solute:Na+ symporter
VHYTRNSFPATNRFTIAVVLFFPFMAIAGPKTDPLKKLEWDIAGKLPSPTGSIPALGMAGPVAGMHEEALLVAGGANFPGEMPWKGGKKAYHSEGFVFLRAQDGKLRSAARFGLPQPIAYSAACSTPLGVVMAGGENQEGLSFKTWLLQWDNGKKQVRISPLPDLPLALSGAALTASGNIVYLAGGQSAKGTSARFFRLNIASPGDPWEELPQLPAPLAYTVLLTQSDGSNPCLYLVGGRKSNPDGISDISRAVHCFDIKKQTWKKKSDLPYPLSASTGVAAGATYLLLFSGDKGEVFTRSEQLIAAIAREQDPEKLDSLNQQRIELMENHPGFSGEVLLYNTVTDVWTTTTPSPFPGQVTTHAVKWGNQIYLPLGEVRAGVRTAEITSAKINSPKLFSTLDYLVLGVYLLLMVGIGLLASRNQKSTDDYFKGGKRIPGWAAGLSIYGTQLSAITFMAIPAKTYATNWNYFFLQMTIILIIPIIARYFIPFFRRLDITSAYEYLEKRFDYAIRAVASLLFIFLQVGRLAIVLLLPSLALSLVTSIDVVFCILAMGVITVFYTMEGGIEAVVWTDVAQVVILLGGALLSVGAMFLGLGMEFTDIWQEVRTSQKLDILDLRISFTEPTFWVVLIGGLAINVISYGTDQTVVQRYLTTKDEKSAIRSLKLGAWMAFPSAIIFFSIGTFLFLFFKQNPQEVNIALQSQDAIFPWYIVSQLPSGVVGLMIAAIFAAAMSTMSSSMNSVTTAIITDFYRRFYPEYQEKTYLRLAQGITLFVGLGGTVLALFMASSGISSLWDQFNTLLGLFTGGLGGLFVLGIFTERANAHGAMAGILLSGAVQYLVKSYTDINLLLYAFTGLVSCVFFGYLFSIVFPRGKKSLAGLTVKTINV